MILNFSYQGVSLFDETVLKAVITQLNRDLTLSGIAFKFNENSIKETFIYDLQVWIEDTLINSENILFNFLYRVDVNQQLIYTSDGLPHENLLKLILNRELQKVVLKRQFSTGADNLLD